MKATSEAALGSNNEVGGACPVAVWSLLLTVIKNLLHRDLRLWPEKSQHKDWWDAGAVLGCRGVSVRQDSLAWLCVCMCVCVCVCKRATVLLRCCDGVGGPPRHTCLCYTLLLRYVFLCKRLFDILSCISSLIHLSRQVSRLPCPLDRNIIRGTFTSRQIQRWRKHYLNKWGAKVDPVCHPSRPARSQLQPEQTLWIRPLCPPPAPVSMKAGWLPPGLFPHSVGPQPPSLVTAGLSTPLCPAPPLGRLCSIVPTSAGLVAVYHADSW